MPLLLEVTYDSVSTEISLAQDFFDLKEVFLLEGHLEQIISIIDFRNFDFTLSREGVDLVLHEE
jgi:hypothetical protein